MEPRDEVIGATWLAERYQLAGLRARGALCTVYQGQDAVLQRPVAIKAPHPDRAAMYRSTLDVTAALTHPAFLALYDTVDQGGRFFLAYEFIEGRPLSDYIVAGLPVRRALAVVSQLTRALAYAHSHGVSHGDLTPAAVLVDRTAMARIANTGIEPDGAYFDSIAESTYASGVADNPDITASLLTEDPERFDCWAVAAILWQLVTDPAPDRTNAPNTSAPDTAARAWRPDVAGDVRLVIEQALRLTRADAITSADTLDKRLREIELALAAPADHPEEPLPPAVSALRAASGRRQRDNAGESSLEHPAIHSGATEAPQSRWRRTGGVSPTAETDYGSLAERAEDTDPHRTHPVDEGRTYPDGNDEPYVAHAPRLVLPARPATPGAAPARWERPHASTPIQASAPQARLGAWVWALVSLAVFALCFLLGFFLAPLAPFLRLP